MTRTQEEHVLVETVREQIAAKQAEQDKLDATRQERKREIEEITKTIESHQDEIDVLREIEKLAGQLNGGGSVSNGATASRPAGGTPPAAGRASRPPRKTSTRRRSEPRRETPVPRGEVRSTRAPAGGDPPKRSTAAGEQNRSKLLQLLGRAGDAGVTQADLTHELGLNGPSVVDHLRKLEQLGKVKRTDELRKGARGGRTSPIWKIVGDHGIKPGQAMSKPDPDSQRGQAKQKIKAAIGQVLWGEDGLPGPQLQAAVVDKLGIGAINGELFADALQECVDDNEVEREPLGNGHGFKYRVAE